MAIERETLRIPKEDSWVLTELASGIKLSTGTSISKTQIVVGLLRMLKGADIDIKKVKSVNDITAQLKAYIRSRKG